MESIALGLEEDSVVAMVLSQDTDVIEPIRMVKEDLGKIEERICVWPILLHLCAI